MRCMRKIINYEKAFVIYNFLTTQRRFEAQKTFSNHSIGDMQLLQNGNCAETIIFIELPQKLCLKGKSMWVNLRIFFHSIGNDFIMVIPQFFLFEQEIGMIIFI